ncbi:hypothetical protein TREES_T100019755 [Tupaia chinensis]|uniref:Uncharacterized protein n=1 Tax=Tupaia chinensis TaxID=246437 RepID=L9JEB3_TUPCH|nr:hypothetical protein TREES_T100019755 [Tupaia chinensis]
MRVLVWVRVKACDMEQPQTPPASILAARAECGRREKKSQHFHPCPTLGPWTQGPVMSPGAEDSKAAEPAPLSWRGTGRRDTALAGTSCEHTLRNGFSTAVSLDHHGTLQSQFTDENTACRWQGWYPMDKPPQKRYYSGIMGAPAKRHTPAGAHSTAFQQNRVGRDFGVSLRQVINRRKREGPMSSPMPTKNGIIIPIYNAHEAPGECGIWR